MLRVFALGFFGSGYAGLVSYQFTVDEFGEESQRKGAKKTEKEMKGIKSLVSFLLFFASLR